MKFIQITDTHLLADNKLDLHGIRTNEKLVSVVSHIIKTNIKDNDFVLLTGDISQDKTTESYEIAASILSKLQKPIYWIAGNHDDIEKLKKVFKKYPFFINQQLLELPHWNFLFIDTNLENADAGYLKQAELDFIESTVREDSQNKKNALIMHHHPVAVGTPLIDEYILVNNQQLWDLLATYKVDLIICGHVHGNYSIKFNRTQIEAGPSTCLQWQKGTREMAIDNLCGYKIFQLKHDQFFAEAVMF